VSAEAFSNVGNRTSMQLVLASVSALAVLAAVCTVVATLVVHDLTEGTLGDSAHVVLKNVGGGIADSLDALFGGALALLLGFYAVLIGPRVFPDATPVPELSGPGRARAADERRVGVRCRAPTGAASVSVAALTDRAL
jgi:hypothetical protein